MKSKRSKKHNWAISLSGLLIVLLINFQRPPLAFGPKVNICSTILMKNLFGFLRNGIRCRVNISAHLCQLSVMVEQWAWILIYASQWNGSRYPMSFVDGGGRDMSQSILSTPCLTRVLLTASANCSAWWILFVAKAELSRHTAFSMGCREGNCINFEGINGTIKVPPTRNTP